MIRFGGSGFYFCPPKPLKKFVTLAMMSSPPTTVTSPSLCCCCCSCSCCAPPPELLPLPPPCFARQLAIHSRASCTLGGTGAPLLPLLLLLVLAVGAAAVAAGLLLLLLGGWAPPCFARQLAIHCRASCTLGGTCGPKTKAQHSTAQHTQQYCVCSQSC